MEKTKPDVVLLPSFDNPLQELRDALRELEAVTERILKRRGY